MTGRVALGADVGGTKICLVAFDLDAGQVVYRDQIPTFRHEGGARVLDRFRRLISEATKNLAKRDIQAVGLGVGVPELVNNDGEIESGWNFDWDQRDIVSDLSEFAPVRLESDARTPTIAEAEYGHGRYHPSFVFVTVGSGLSYAYCNDGVIHRGANGYAIHFASSEIKAVCNACGRQEGFILEALASGRGLSETFKRQTGRHCTAQDLFHSEPESEQALLLSQATDALASYLAQLVNIFDPHALIIGGGLGTNPQYFNALRDKTRPNIWAPNARNLAILDAGVARDGAAIGAAMLFK